MDHESADPMAHELLPPVRTKSVRPRPTTASQSPLLPPVRSGLFAEEAADAGHYEIYADEITIEIEGLEDTDITLDAPVLYEEEAGVGEVIEEATPEPEPLDPWSTVDEPVAWDGSADEESAEIVLDDGLEMDEAEAVELILEDEESVDVEEEDAHDVRPGLAPVSPWDLGAAGTSADARAIAARAREEWESLGQALSESLGPPSGGGTGSYGYELTDERAAQLEDGDAAQSFGAPSLGQDWEGGSEAALAELARRLEAFAASLRKDGELAIARAHSADDRFNALLASFASTYLAGGPDER